MSTDGVSLGADREGDDPDADREAIKAALVRLHDQQRDELQSFREGFESREKLIRWLHDFQLVTLGRVDEDVFQHLGTRTVPLVVCITSSERYDIAPTTDVTLEAAREERRLLAASYLRPPCRQALRDMRASANQYVGDEEDEEPPDPEKAPNTAMRPILDEYHERQEALLSSFLGGFGGRAAIDDWLHRLDLATYGELREVCDDLDHRIATKPSLRRALLRDAPGYQRTREHLAAKVLLPACNRAIRELQKIANESTEQTRETLSAPPG